jgi:hypothetical protein
MRARVSRALDAAGAGARCAAMWLRRAPGTLVWLAILLVTEAISMHLAPEALHDVLGARSTNLYNLAHDPVHVLVVSAFWLAGGTWLEYLVIFLVFMAPAERWLGTWRWLAVVATAHVVATYVSQGIVFLAIRNGAEPVSEVHTLDYGVSYALAGVQAVLTWHIARPWRWLYLAGLLGVYVVPLTFDLDFTKIGHLTAALLGLALYPVTRGRGAPWDPWTAWPLSRWTRARQVAAPAEEIEPVSVRRERR